MSEDDFIEPAASIDFQLSPRSLPADECSRTRLTIAAKDKSRKPVMDGVPVSWHLEQGLGELVEQEEEIKDGQASAILVSGGYSEDMIVSAQVDSVTASVTVPIRNLKLTLTPESESLSTDAGVAGSFPSTTRVIAVIADEDGVPVADGTQINWFVSAGKFEKDGASLGNIVQTEALDGRASVCVNTEGARSGSILLCISIASFFSSRQLQFVPPPGLALATDHLVLAGDAQADGTHEVERLDREPLQAPFFTMARFSIRGGVPNKPAEIRLAGPGAIYAELVGNGIIELDANGNGSFQLKSNGKYRSGDSRFYPVRVSVSQDETHAAALIKIGPSAGYAQMYGLGHLLPWDDLDCEMAATEFAAGMIFGAKTPLELGLRLAMFAGTEETSFACMGILASHSGSKSES